METSTRVIADSISESGVRLVTMVLEYPRIIHSEFMTHRMFSRNASSSRAIPVENQVGRITLDGFTPSEFGKNKRGMQADSKLDEKSSKLSESVWNLAKSSAINSASLLAQLDVHKQLANRLLEPFSYIQVVITATEWDNFFLQRLNKNAQPEIQELARVMKEAMDSSTPKLLKAGEWHLPFVTKEDLTNYKFNTGSQQEVFEFTRKLSVARCARVSYGLNERGWGDVEKDLALYELLLTNNHWSPFEHQATPIEYQADEYAELEMALESVGVTHVDKKLQLWSGNFRGWIQNRQLIQQTK